jgi:putative redox protein
MTIRVVRDQRALMRHDVRIGNYKLTTDLSVANGGEGSGPAPHDVYDAALGASERMLGYLAAEVVNKINPQRHP